MKKAIAELRAGTILNAEEWHRISGVDGEGANHVLASMSGVATIYHVWLIDGDETKIVAVQEPSGGTGLTRYMRVSVISVGTHGEYPRVLADVVDKVKTECEENWG